MLQNGKTAAEISPAPTYSLALVIRCVARFDHDSDRSQLDDCSGCGRPKAEAIFL